MMIVDLLSIGSRESNIWYLSSHFLYILDTFCIQMVIKTSESDAEKLLFSQMKDLNARFDLEDSNPNFSNATQSHDKVPPYKV